MAQLIGDIYQLSFDNIDQMVVSLYDPCTDLSDGMCDALQKGSSVIQFDFLQEQAPTVETKWEGSVRPVTSIFHL